MAYQRPVLLDVATGLVASLMLGEALGRCARSHPDVKTGFRRIGAWICLTKLTAFTHSTIQLDHIHIKACLSFGHCILPFAQQPNRRPGLWVSPPVASRILKTSVSVLSEALPRSLREAVKSPALNSQSNCAYPVVPGSHQAYLGGHRGEEFALPPKNGRVPHCVSPLCQQRPALRRTGVESRKVQDLEEPAGSPNQ